MCSMESSYHCMEAQKNCFQFKTLNDSLDHAYRVFIHP